MTRKAKLHLVGQDPADIFDDLDKLKAAVSAWSEPTRKGWRRHSTTVPREWELRLKQVTRVSTYRLALELLYRRWRADQDKFGRVGEPVIVSSEVTSEAGLSKRSAGNALDQLEQLGLIEVARAQGRAPRASLLHIPTKTSRR